MLVTTKIIKLIKLAPIPIPTINLPAKFELKPATKAPIITEEFSIRAMEKHIESLYKSLSSKPI